MSRWHEGKKLPPGWVKCESSKYDASYFFDTQTGKSSWFPPEALAISGNREQEQPSSPPEPYESPPPPIERAQVRPLEDSFPPPQAKRSRPGGASLSSAAGDGGVKVAVIVPFRDLHREQRRGEHLKRFVPYMEDFLYRQGVASFRVFIVEQSVDGRKFNRGKLLNVGFDLARQEDCAVFLFHDVDLLPSDELGM